MTFHSIKMIYSGVIAVGDEENNMSFIGTLIKDVRL